MKFLPSISGPEFLVLYFLYAIIILTIYIVIRSINSRKKDDDYIAYPLTEEEFFVLNNEFYNPNNIFYYITYRLYAKKLLIKLSDGTFKSESNARVFSADLNNIEREVFKLYNDGFKPKDFKTYMIKESILKNYYDSIKSKLIKDGLVATYKKAYHYGIYLILFIPGLLRAIGGFLNDKPINSLIFEIAVIFIFTLAIEQFFVDKKISKRKKASIDLFKRNYTMGFNDLGQDSLHYRHVMESFILGGLLWKKDLGLYSNSGKSSTSSYDNNSSCSSCDSCSSCSSCSSCGGCGND